MLRGFHGGLQVDQQFEYIENSPDVKTLSEAGFDLKTCAGRFVDVDTLMSLRRDRSVEKIGRFSHSATKLETALVVRGTSSNGRALA